MLALTAVAAAVHTVIVAGPVGVKAIPIDAGKKFARRAAAAAAGKAQRAEQRERREFQLGEHARAFYGDRSAFAADGSALGIIVDAAVAQLEN